MVKSLMAWVELHITTTALQANPIGDQLLLLGAEALTLRDAGDQPIYEPAPATSPVWDATIVIGLFNENVTLEPILLHFEKQKAAGLLSHLEVKPVAEEDWERRCLENFKPLSFGKRLWICPSWLTPKEPDKVNIILDPGLAFGTGTHPTTALCLEWLDQYLIENSTVIDYGCGSGILAIAALKLGAKKVLAVDHDPQALLATRQNGERNKVKSGTLETSLPTDFIAQPVDLLMANILAQPLIDFAEHFSNLVHPEGILLLSGVLNHQVESVVKTYEPWFTIKSIVSKEDWARIEGKRH